VSTLIFPAKDTSAYQGEMPASQPQNLRRFFNHICFAQRTTTTIVDLEHCAKNAAGV
jgi:hypothetical protein